MDNDKVDWTKAPAEADGWMWSEIAGPIWVSLLRGGFPISGTTDTLVPVGQIIAVPLGEAPAFGWTAGASWHVTRRP
jgi:hypothetical protein